MKQTIYIFNCTIYLSQFVELLTKTHTMPHLFYFGFIIVAQVCAVLYLIERMVMIVMFKYVDHSLKLLSSKLEHAQWLTLPPFTFVIVFFSFMKNNVLTCFFSSKIFTHWLFFWKVITDEKTSKGICHQYDLINHSF